MTNLENHRTFTALVAIAALASVLVVSTSAISGHIALADTTNSGIDSSQSNSATSNCETAGSGGTISSSCQNSISNSFTNSGGVLH